MHRTQEAATYFSLHRDIERGSPQRKAALNKWHNGKCDENLLPSFSKPKHRHYQISGSNAELAPYHHFLCLFGRVRYLMNPYRGHTVLVHMSRYLAGPFLRAPAGRVCSLDTSCKIPQLPGSWKKETGWSRTGLWILAQLVFLLLFFVFWVTAQRPRPQFSPKLALCSICVYLHNGVAARVLSLKLSLRLADFCLSFSSCHMWNRSTAKIRDVHTLCCVSGSDLG